MIDLISIKKFIEDKKIVDLGLLLRTFQNNRAQILACLHTLEQKGKIKSCVKKIACSKPCGRCPIAVNTIEYHWIDPVY